MLRNCQDMLVLRPLIHWLRFQEYVNYILGLYNAFCKRIS